LKEGIEITLSLLNRTNRITDRMLIQIVYFALVHIKKRFFRGGGEKIASSSSLHPVQVLLLATMDGVRYNQRDSDCPALNGLMTEGSRHYYAMGMPLWWNWQTCLPAGRRA